MIALKKNTEQRAIEKVSETTNKNEPVSCHKFGFEGRHIPNSRSVEENSAIIADLVVDEDDNGEGDGRDPPLECQRVHPQPLVHARAVGEEGGQGGLEEETKVQEGVVHSLLEHRVAPCLADDEIGPLHDHDGDEECRVAGVLQNLAVSAKVRSI